MKKLLFCLFISMTLLTCNNSKTNNKVGYSGSNLDNEAFILRNKETKKTSFEIKTDGEWKLFAGHSVEDIDFSDPVAVGDKPGIFSINVPVTERYYFQLITEDGSAILSERQLPMVGGYNFRDLGGFKNIDGKHVKWGLIFRSDDLNKLTTEDLDYLATIPIISIADFRADSEVDAAPDLLPLSVKKVVRLDITPGNIQGGIPSFNDLSAIRADSIMEAMNRQFVTDNECIKQYKRLFEMLQSGSDTPLMFHCSAGKDRTGMAAALILYSLGVDEETILKDYLSSNQYLGDKYAVYVMENPELKSLFEVKPCFLMAGINQIKKDYGSVDNFLKEKLSVDIDKMKSLYLY